VQRHFDDVAASRKRAFRFKFDPAKAEKKLKLIQLLPHTKGEWAFKRQLITLEGWQLFGLAVTFGWVKKKGGHRPVPRKLLGSAAQERQIRGRRRSRHQHVRWPTVSSVPRVYSGATTEKQAWEVFRPAKLMVTKSPMLVQAAGIEVNASNMNIPSDFSRFEPLIGNPGDGASPSCAIVDEYHEHPTSAQYDTCSPAWGQGGSR